MPEPTQHVNLLEGQGAAQTSANIAAAQAAFERGQSAAATSAHVQQAIAAVQAAQIDAGSAQRGQT